MSQYLRWEPEQGDCCLSTGVLAVAVGTFTPCRCRPAACHRTWLRGHPAYAGQAGFLPRLGSDLASLHAYFHCFRVGFRCRSRLFLIRRRFRIFFRSDFVMLNSLLALSVRHIICGIIGHLQVVDKGRYWPAA